MQVTTIGKAKKTKRVDYLRISIAVLLSLNVVIDAAMLFVLIRLAG